MPTRKGLLAPQNNFLDAISTKFNGTHSNFLLGSAQVPGVFPIVYCSDGFCELTGFQRGQVMQNCCSCDFLFGENTNPLDMASIKSTLLNKKELKIEIIMYKKNGDAFWCLLDIVPIKNGENNVVMFLVSHKELRSCQPAALQDSLTSLNGNNITGENGINDSENDTECDLSRQTNFKRMGHRRRSRAVLYNLSETLDKKQKEGCLKKFGRQCFGGHKTTMPEYKVANAKPSRFTILHFSMSKTIWDWVVMLVTIYVTAIVPYYAALQSVGNAKNETVGYGHLLHRSGAVSIATFVFDIIVEIIFVIDIAMTFRTTYVSKSGWVILDPRKIAINYLKTWFLIDLIAALPVDTISHIFNVDFSTQPVPMLKIVRLLRLFRLYHKIERWSQYSAVILTMLMLMFGLVAHWLACIWFTIGWSEIKNREPGTDIATGWLFELSTSINKPFYSNGTGGPDATSSYITSLYFTLSSLTSVGFGNVSANTNAEKIFSICVMTIGALMHAVVFGSVTAIIQRMYARRSQYDIKMRDLKDFIKIHRLSKQVKRRIIEYFQNTWEANGGVNPNEVMKELPADIQADVAIHIHKEIFNMPVFSTGSEGFKRCVSLHTFRRKVSPGEYVVYSGEPLMSVNLVCTGSLEVLYKDLVTSILGKGDLFGADVMVCEKYVTTSNYGVRALTYCELEGVTIEGMRDAMKYYPEYAPTFLKEIRSEYACLLYEDRLHHTQARSYESIVTSSKTNSVEINSNSDIFEDKPQLNDLIKNDSINVNKNDDTTDCVITMNNNGDSENNRELINRTLNEHRPLLLTNGGPNHQPIERPPKIQPKLIKPSSLDVEICSLPSEGATHSPKYFKHLRKGNSFNNFFHAISSKFGNRERDILDDRYSEDQPNIDVTLTPCIKKSASSHDVLCSPEKLFPCENITMKRVKFRDDVTDSAVNQSDGRKVRRVSLSDKVDREKVVFSVMERRRHSESPIALRGVRLADFSQMPKINFEKPRKDSLEIHKNKTDPCPDSNRVLSVPRNSPVKNEQLIKANRRRKRTRRKSNSPNGSNYSRARFRLEDRESLSDSTAHSSSKTHLWKEPCLSGGELSDSVFSNNSFGRKKRNTNRKYEILLEQLFELNSKVSFFGAEIQSLTSQLRALVNDGCSPATNSAAELNSCNSLSDSSLLPQEVSAEPFRPREKLENSAGVEVPISRRGLCHSPYPHARRLSPPKKREPDPVTSSLIPTYTLTNPTGGDDDVIIDMEVEDAITPQIAEPKRRRDSRILDPPKIPENGGVTANYFTPISHVSSPLIRPSKTELSLPVNGTARGNESGYISNSPTIYGKHDTIF